MGTAFSLRPELVGRGLKLWNAMSSACAVTYTFVQGGHVRVDLVYSAVSHRTKRLIDMFGCCSS
jgi:TRAP-type mannitol/chloroaromatic compound transport system permease small subunit